MPYLNCQAAMAVLQKMAVNILFYNQPNILSLPNEEYLDTSPM